MVQKSMERLPTRFQRYPRQVGAIILGATLLLGNEAYENPKILEKAPHSFTKNTFSPFSYDVFDSQMLGAAVRDPTTGEYIIIKDDVPEPRRAAFHESITNPIAKLGGASGSPNAIIINESTNEGVSTTQKPIV